MSRPAQTPAKKLFALPTLALEKAIDAEWVASQKFTPSAMPLTSLAYTSIDRIAGQERGVVESLLVYIDTDALCYRSLDSQLLADKQEAEWGEVLAWVQQRFDVHMEVTRGVMPIEQPEMLTHAFDKYLSAQSAFRLTAAALLASFYNSVCLTIAVLEKHIGASDAFMLSRLEENHQIEQWGEDEDAAKRVAQMAKEIAAIERFLKLLDAA